MQGKLHEAVEGLLNLEKTCRLQEDITATKACCAAVLDVCFQARQWKLLEEQIILLSKRRSQFKQVRQDSCAMLYPYQSRCPGVISVTYPCWSRMVAGHPDVCAASHDVHRPDTRHRHQGVTHQDIRGSHRGQGAARHTHTHARTCARAYTHTDVCCSRARNTVCP